MLSKQLSQVLISFIDCRSKICMKASIRHARRWCKCKSIWDHGLKFQDQRSKYYWNIKANTCFQWFLQLVGLRNKSQSLWIDGIATGFMHVENSLDFITCHNYPGLYHIGRCHYYALLLPGFLSLGSETGRVKLVQDIPSVKLMITNHLNSM